MRSKRNYTLFIQLFIFTLFLLIWEILSSKNIINSFLLSKPSSIFNLLVEYIENKKIWSHCLISINEAIFGLILGTILGLIFAFFLWLSPKLEEILRPFLNILNALPKTALAPIIIIWIGANMKGIVAVAISIIFIITVLNAHNYFKTVDEDMIKMFKSFNAKRITIFFKLILPINLKNILSIVKVNLGLSWVGVIVGEFLVSKKGLGYLIMYGGAVFKLDLVMMSIFVLSLFAFLMYIILELLEKIILKGRYL